MSASPRLRVSASPCLLERASLSALCLLGALLCALWLLLCVCLGATDLREEMRALGID